VTRDRNATGQRRATGELLRLAGQRENRYGAVGGTLRWSGACNDSAGEGRSLALGFDFLEPVLERAAAEA